MKNIHVLKTDKPSRLLKDLVDGTYQFKKEVSYGNRLELPLNIYITNSEEIKEGDWVITPTNDIIQWAKVFQPIGKKIILTTDQYLIRNNVQAIDDEFLEWYVKNPSCEEVEVEKMFNVVQFTSREFIYKIIIPKETLEKTAVEWFSDEITEIMYSKEEVLEFTQTIIQHYKLGNTNIEQLDLLKETLEQFKNK